jgi:hypothetical protein
MGVDEALITGKPPRQSTATVESTASIHHRDSAGRGGCRSVAHCRPERACVLTRAREGFRADGTRKVRRGGRVSRQTGDSRIASGRGAMGMKRPESAGVRTVAAENTKRELARMS